MNLQLNGFEQHLALNNEAISVLEVHNRKLFARICQSLESEMDAEALEPYALWDEDRLCSSRNRFLFVFNPFDLPWSERTLMSKVFERIETTMMEDDDIRQDIELMGRALSNKIAALGLSLQSEYAFEVQWEMRKYLKAFAFGVESNPSDTLLDNLMRFFTFASDAGLEKQLVFVNLKNFLLQNEVQELYNQAFFLKLHVLLLENTPDESSYEYERKMVIDQDLLQW